MGICHDQSAHLPHFALLANNQSNPFSSLHFTSFHLAATLSRWPMGQPPSWASCCHFCPHLHVAARTQSYLVTVLQKSSQWSPMIMGQRPTSPSWPRSLQDASPSSLLGPLPLTPANGTFLSSFSLCSNCLGTDLGHHLTGWWGLHLSITAISLEAWLRLALK